MKYRKKPVVIEAFQLGYDEMPDWFIQNETDRVVTLQHICETTNPPIYKTICDIQTLEGTMRANHGDFIIKGVNGELYPCKPGIFVKTYEPLEGHEVKPSVPGGGLVFDPIYNAD
jgi:hypothetical protein